MGRGKKTHNLIGQNQQVVIDSNLRELLELRSSEHLSNGVVRSVENDDLGLGSDSSSVGGKADARER